jgi:hypothetical protein
MDRRLQSTKEESWRVNLRRGLWILWAAAVRRYFCLSRQPTGVGAAVAGTLDVVAVQMLFAPPVPARTQFDQDMPRSRILSQEC